MNLRPVPTINEPLPGYGAPTEERRRQGSSFRLFRDYRCPPGEDISSSRLDEIAKRAAAGMSRRGVLTGILGALAVAVVASVAGCTKPPKRDLSKICPQCGTCAECNSDTSTQSLVCASCNTSCEANAVCTKAYNDLAFVVLTGYLKSHGYAEASGVNLYQPPASATPSGAASSTPTSASSATVQDPSKGEADIVRFRTDGITQFTTWAVTFTANGGTQRAAAHFVVRPTGTTHAYALVAETTSSPTPVTSYYSLYVRHDLTVVKVGANGATYPRYGLTTGRPERSWNWAQRAISPASDANCLTACLRVCTAATVALCNVVPLILCAKYLDNPIVAQVCTPKAQAVFQPLCSGYVNSECSVYCASHCSCTGCLSCQECSAGACYSNCGSCATCTTAGCQPIICDYSKICGPDGTCECPQGQDPCRNPVYGIDECKDLSSDYYNCGECGHVCSASVTGISGQTCIAGVCSCASGETVCNGACIDLSGSPENCGACGQACPPLQNCHQGQCCYSGSC
jgi:hypothetical protein